MKKEALEKDLQKHIAQWITKNANRDSLITVAALELSPDISHARVGVSVLPEKYEKDALRFLQKHVVDIKMHLKKNTRGMLPKTYAWHIDEGAKKRDAIYRLIAKSDET